VERFLYPLHTIVSKISVKNVAKFIVKKLTNSQKGYTILSQVFQKFTFGYYFQNIPSLNSLERSAAPMKKGKVSNAVIRRLPRYYRTLDALYLEGTVRISSSALGKSMGITASQIRQDLSCFGEFGQQGYGYNIADLRREIADILGMNYHYTAILLGAGNLGRALMRNFKFAKNGFHLTAAFDTNPDIVGTEINGLPVYHIDQLEEYLAQNPTSVGVLTLPKQTAQPMADKLIAGGVKGIWNFTSTELNVHNSGVVVENVHFADSLLTLSYLISE
jgi:redox-sensing transcriptional repressor